MSIANARYVPTFHCDILIVKWGNIPEKITWHGYIPAVFGVIIPPKH